MKQLKAPYMVTISPLTERVNLPSMRGDRCALILVSDPHRRLLTNSVQALRQAFDLTSAEARTAILVGNGMAPKEVADKLGVSVGTIRCELKSVFSKLDISR
jgi:DNA-binding CsgD family transcriptional regulator